MRPRVLLVDSDAITSPRGMKYGGVDENGDYDPD